MPIDLKSQTIFNFFFPLLNLTHVNVEIFEVKYRLYDKAKRIVQFQDFIYSSRKY